MWKYIVFVVLCILVIGFTVLQINCDVPGKTVSTEKPVETITIKLPEPRYDSDFSIEQSLLRRRSVRTYTGEPLKLIDLSQLLWAAQGITDAQGFRTAPSAGALYPLELWVVAGNVEMLSPGIYRYKPDEHAISLVDVGDRRKELAKAALSQSCVDNAAISIIITAVYSRTTVKYGDRGIRYVHIEAGHAAQNICLQSTAMNLGTVTIGAFYDEEVAKLLNLPKDEVPIYILPTGNK